MQGDKVAERMELSQCPPANTLEVFEPCYD